MVSKVWDTCNQEVEESYLGLSGKKNMNKFLDKLQSPKDSMYLHEDIAAGIRELATKKGIKINEEALIEILSNDTLSYDLDYDEDLDEKDQQFLTNVFLEVLSVGTANLYRKFENDITMDHINNIVNLLNKNNINLPNIDKIKFSHVSENDGWGYDIIKVSEKR